jgi:hypothetical protein
MATKSAKDILDAYTSVVNTLITAGLRPKFQTLDNECSTILKQYLTQQNIAYQMVPPGIHRANAAERAIRTFKNHFISGLCTTDPNFPMHLWDRLIPQALLTLNLLRSSRINPNLSAYAQVFGQYDFAAHPIAPPGIHMLVHKKPALRSSWAPHALNAWYVGPALQHYRCHRAWVWTSRHERITDTVTWVPRTIPVPEPTIHDLILDNTDALIRLLAQQSPDAHHPATQNLLQLADALRHPLMTTPAPPAPTPTPPLAPNNPPPALTVPTSPVLPAPALRVASPPPAAPPVPTTVLLTPPSPPAVLALSPPLLPSPALRVPPRSNLTKHKRHPKKLSVSARTTKLLPEATSAQWQQVPTVTQDSDTDSTNDTTDSDTSPSPPVAPTMAPRNNRRHSKHGRPRKLLIAPIQPPTRSSKRNRCPTYKTQQPFQQTAQTAINVDTGHLAEYHQLLQSTEGPLSDVGRPVPAKNGPGSPKVSPSTAFPPRREPTPSDSYLSPPFLLGARPLIRASSWLTAPRNPNLDESALRSAGTKSTTRSK